MAWYGGIPLWSGNQSRFCPCQLLLFLYPGAPIVPENIELPHVSSITHLIWLVQVEDVNILISYSGSVGFSIKEYEKKYLVKEGPYSPWQSDFPTRRSQLVVAKRSLNVVADVQSRIDSIKDSAVWPVANRLVPSSPTPEEDMPDYEDQDVSVVDSSRPAAGSSSSQSDTPSLTLWRPLNTIASPSKPSVFGTWTAVQPEAQQVGNKRKPSEDDVIIHKRRDTKVVTINEGHRFKAISEMLIHQTKENENVRTEFTEAAVQGFEDSTARRAEEASLYQLQVAQRLAEEEAQRRAEEDQKERLRAAALERKRHEEELRIEMRRVEAHSGKARLWLRFVGDFSCMKVANFVNPIRFRMQEVEVES